MTMTCPKCDGTGAVLDPRMIGARLRSEREGRKVTVTAVAGALGYTKAYISDLELGRRRWSPVLVERYRAALDVAQREDKR